MGGTSTVSVTHPDEDGGAVVRKRRRLYFVTTSVLCLLAVAVIVDGFAPVFGVDTAAVEQQTADGRRLRVEYAELTRPALASPFAIEVTDADGFTEPIELAVSRSFIELWDENGMYPTPSAERGDEQWVVWEFDPPDGTTLRFFYDARLEPARQRGFPGRVQWREDGVPVAEVSFDVKVRP